MEDILTALEDAYADSGYDVADVSRNRSQVRVVLLDEDAAASDLREIVTAVAGEDAVLGLDVTTDTVEGHDGMNTVVTFQYRP